MFIDEHGTGWEETSHAGSVSAGAARIGILISLWCAATEWFTTTTFVGCHLFFQYLVNNVLGQTECVPLEQDGIHEPLVRSDDGHACLLQVLDIGWVEAPCGGGR